jgi:hypothetical protein
MGVIHMNGRIYDPLVGRMMSADPFIQAPGNLQSYNRYSYVMNNPLNLTDPTGYFSLSGFFKNPFASFNNHGDRVGGAILGLPFGSKGYHAVFNFLQGSGGYQLKSAVISGLSLYCGWWAAACNGGGQAGLAKAYGASDSDAFNAGGQAALSTGLFQWAGTVGGAWGADSFGRYLAHAGAGCVSSAAGGGNCGQGAASAVFGKYATNQLQGFGGSGLQGDIARGVAAMVAGGVGSVIGGGKFENGAKTAAYGYLFNQLTTTQKPIDIGKTSSRIDKIKEFFNYQENYDQGYEAGATYKQQLADDQATLEARIAKSPDPQLARTQQESAGGYKSFGTSAANLPSAAWEAAGDRNIIKTFPFVRGYITGYGECVCKGVSRE